jgi:stress response protein YsnF
MPIQRERKNFRWLKKCSISRQQTTRKVRVHTKLEIVEERIEEELTTEQVFVTRKTVNAYVDAAPTIRTVGDLTIIPVLEEVLVLEKKLLLKEEIYIQRKEIRETVVETVPVRKQRAVIEAVGEKKG